MLRPAFSTVACPDWTLDRVAQAAAEFRFAGVELRSMGLGKTELACDPGLTDPDKTRRLFRDAGVEIASIGTSVSFDALVFPPVIGHVLPARDASVREGKRMVMLAEGVGAPFVRVFGFHKQGRETRRTCMQRVVDRLSKVCDAARNREVTVLIENGGSFPLAEDLAEIISRVASPYIAACYDLATGVAVGEDPYDAVRVLGPSIRIARLKDMEAGVQVPLGQGEFPCREFVTAMRTSGTRAWVVYTWEKAWLPHLAPPERVLPEAAQLMWDWIGPASMSSAA